MQEGEIVLLEDGEEVVPRELLEVVFVLEGDPQNAAPAAAGLSIGGRPDPRRPSAAWIGTVRGT